MRIISLLHETREHNGERWIDVLKEVKEDMPDYAYEHDLVGENSYDGIQGAIVLKTDLGKLMISVSQGRSFFEMNIFPCPEVTGAELDDFIKEIFNFIFSIPLDWRNIDREIERTKNSRGGIEIKFYNQ